MTTKTQRPRGIATPGPEQKKPASTENLATPQRNGKDAEPVRIRTVDDEDEERCLRDVEDNLENLLHQEPRLQRIAAAANLTTAHLRNPKNVAAYDRAAARARQSTDGQALAGGIVERVRTLATRLVAAAPHRPPWEDEAPTPASSGAAEHAPIEPMSTARKPQPPNDRADAPRAAPQRQRKQPPADVERPRKERPREILWLNQLLLDGVPAECFRLGYVIAQLWSRHTDYANPAQSTIAEVLRRSERTVRRLIGPLVGRGHLEVVSTGLGRGHTSTYRPIIKKPEQPFLISKRPPTAAL